LVGRSALSNLDRAIDVSAVEVQKSSQVKSLTVCMSGRVERVIWRFWELNRGSLKASKTETYDLGEI
jgi:hypothetical protein